MSGSETAFADLRKRGLAAVGKKAARTAAEGLLGLSVTPAGVAIIEINSETDFVARNEQFQVRCSKRSMLSNRSAAHRIGAQE